MLIIQRLNELQGAEKYGSCSSCGVLSSKNKNVLRVRASVDKGQFSSICLCESCLKQIMSELKLRPRRKQSEWVLNKGAKCGEPYYYCANCIDGGSDLGTENYCSNCGYKMKQGDRPWKRG